MKALALGPGVCVRFGDSEGIVTRPAPRNLVRRPSTKQDPDSNPNALVDVFGQRGVQVVIDVGARNGNWLIDIRNTGWLAENPRRIGVDNTVPSPYKGDLPCMRMPRGITEYRADSPRPFPRRVAADVLHEAFLDRGPAADSSRFSKYDSAVRGDGHFIFASNPDICPQEVFETWLTDRGYPYHVYGEEAPPVDYPTTFWWHEIVGMLSRQHSPEDRPRNYLILARKLAGAD